MSSFFFFFLVWGGVGFCGRWVLGLGCLWGGLFRLRVCHTRSVLFPVEDLTREPILSDPFIEF